MKIAYIRGLYAVCCFLCFLQCTSAQPLNEADDAEDNPVPVVIRVNSSLVSVPVSVTDASGRKITDLRIKDFRLAEDGRTAEISRLAERSKLNIALLFDLSGSVNHSF